MRSRRRAVGGRGDHAQDLLFLVHETPMFAIQVMRSLASRIRELDDRI